MKTILFLIFLTPPLFSQWNSGEYFPLYSEYSKYGLLTFLTPDRPLLVEYEINFILQDDNTIMHYKVPGDTTWYMHFWEQGLLKNINFINRNDFFSMNGTFLRKSTNGGFSWNQIFDFKDLYSSGWVNDLYFKNEMNGYAVGTTGGSVPNIFGYFAKTTDGGQTWTSQTINNTTDCKLIKVLNDTTMFISASTGSYDRLFKSSNDGVNWNMLYGGYAMYTTHKLYFFDDQTGWAVGYYGQIEKTTDGGENWINVSPGSINDYRDCYFMTRNIGWVVGSANGTDTMTVIRTSDGGNSWTISPNLASAKQILFVNPDTGYIVTDNHIYKTSNGGGYPTKTIESDKASIQSFFLSQNYPNPFNPITNIEYQIPKNAFVNLKVYDVLGNEIVTLIKGEKPAGNYSVQFDGNKLASGIYIYRLVAGEFVSIKKMVLIK